MMKGMMRIVACAVLLLVTAALPSKARSAAPAVGFQEVRIPVDGEPSLAAGIWYPSRGVARPAAVGPFAQTIVASGPVVGRSLPLLLISHGGGGSFASHFDTALAFARAGFVVASVSHAGDTFDDQSKVLMLWRRPVQLSLLLTYVLKDWKSHGQIDPLRVGAYGFSNGGFTVLVEAGGMPNIARFDPYCGANPQHDVCIALRNAGVISVAAAIEPPADAWRQDRRIRAIAMAAPAFAFAFDRDDLSKVDIPVQLWRAADDQHQPDPWYETHLLTTLPTKPELQVVPLAGHYAFLPPCTPLLRAEAPGICVDQPGFDRATFHGNFNASLVKFFLSSLKHLQANDPNPKAP
jgi:predicted dienelactone hydrolase